MTKVLTLWAGPLAPARAVESGPMDSHSVNVCKNILALDGTVNLSKTVTYVCVSYNWPL